MGKMHLPFSKLVRMACPDLAKKGGLAVALFKAYVDESTDTGNVLFVVGGFVAPESVWDSLEGEWPSALPPYCRYFHSTECFAGSGQFDGVDASEREGVLHRLTDILARKEMWLIAYGLRAETYRKLAPKPRANRFWGNRYVGLFSGVVEAACWCANSPIPPHPTGETSGTCVFFIEKSDYSGGARKALQGMRADPSLWWRRSIGAETFGSKEGPAAIPLLQVADLGAFLAAKKLGQSPDRRVPWKQFYDKLGGAGRIFKVVRVTDDELRVFHRQFLDDPGVSPGC